MSDALPKPDDDGDGDLILDTLWARTLEAWDEDRTHNAVLDYALRAERLPVLAGRYRALKDDADKGPRAKKRIDAIVLAATQMLMAHKTPPKGKVPLPMTLSVVMICAITVGWMAYAILRH